MTKRNGAKKSRVKNSGVKESGAKKSRVKNNSTKESGVQKSAALTPANIMKQEEAPYFSDLDQYLFGQGTHYEIFKKLGAHKAHKDKQDGYYFAVWAPNAKAVSVVGDFNGWNISSHPMKRHDPLGVYDIFVPGLKAGELYKYYITTQSDKGLYKADPYANYAQMRPETASVLTDISDFSWTDGSWIKARKSRNVNQMPISIYEVHPGSWMRHPYREDNKEGFYNYREFAHALCTYVKEMGYTHVELMGIAEHPFDGSWGYQVTGYYAPTSRYGTPTDFMYLVNYMHENGIGVILDWVPSHFPRDAHGLANFDGGCVYEYADPKKGEHPDWGTKIFDYSKNEVKNFLIGNAIFWIEEFHVDGLRVDAVASILYLDYGKQDGQWVANKYGENKNLEAIEFFKHLNSVILGRNHGAMMIAEESTAWPLVTGKPEENGLGFSMKWNMGWMHDFLEYMKEEPRYRQYHHQKMTFAMTYAYAEKYLLVLSHDEVVHLKRSMFNKMPGEYSQKFANLKVAYTFMLGHPGKKLLFMGQDFGQLGEWNEDCELDWYLLEEESHQQLKYYVKTLLHLYRKMPALYEVDYHPDGFEWMNANDYQRCIFSFVRYGVKGTNRLLFVMNFSPKSWPDYCVGVPENTSYRLILNSDENKFGGGGSKLKSCLAKEKDCDGRTYSITFDLPAFGAVVFEF